MPAVAQTATHQPAAASPVASASTAPSSSPGRGLAAAERGRDADAVEARSGELARERGADTALALCFGSELAARGASSQRGFERRGTHRPGSSQAR